MSAMVARAPLHLFLAGNPFRGALTDGLFFRDKMRAIHRVAPDLTGSQILEIGGGRSGLTKLLYPDAEVVNLDADPGVADAACNLQAGQRLVTGSATALPFEDESFACVTMFDILEHVEDDALAASEAMRVVRRDGVIIVTTPSRERWRYPHYRFMRPLCPPEERLLREWGHVRRGYRQEELDALFGRAAEATGSFVNSGLALSHDIAFSKLPRPLRFAAHVLAAPVSLAGWLANRPGSPGAEIAATWRKPGSPD
ncbi:class I SAM-dependent methyltransferase [Novosphingobium marinum]|uniref:SAM-dependent methyltransferase n=1 Tax=Novosphingobium marinum TaxID=1514948 RepID=A0A7Y9XVR0_9SPHN|nr:class I SAM-dependent methyltransferase [Novosphingobium marinum]NYH95387.1 SAM-dependent methyltransferase [Novosphingobium marinum]